MGLLEAIILGIIQGLTEFLPVSSSGHLELGKAILGNDQIPEESLLFTVAVHVATALSTIIVYRKTVGDLLMGLFRFKWNEETRYVTMIALSMIPVMIVGLFFEEELEAMFEGRIVLVGAMLLVTAALLYFTHRAVHREGGVTFKKSFIIGLAQAVAVLPGISRSGSTIATSLLLGVSREKAARFSFLMVLPPILGAAILKLKDLGDAESSVAQLEWTPVIAGFIAAFISGYIACTWMIRIVKKSKLSYFAIYCAVVGLIAIGAGLWVS